LEAISLSLSATNPEISVEEADLVDSKSIFRNSWGRRSLNGKPKEALTNDSPKDAIMADGLTPLVDWIYSMRNLNRTVIERMIALHFTFRLLIRNESANHGKTLLYVRYLVNVLVISSKLVDWNNYGS
jgi:hypothetical protein